jgi:hypothetical protein
MPISAHTGILFSVSAYTRSRGCGCWLDSLLAGGLAQPYPLIFAAASPGLRFWLGRIPFDPRVLCAVVPICQVQSSFLLIVLQCDPTAILLPVDTSWVLPRLPPAPAVTLWLSFGAGVVLRCCHDITRTCAPHADSSFHRLDSSDGLHAPFSPSSSGFVYIAHATPRLARLRRSTSSSMPPLWIYEEDRRHGHDALLVLRAAHPSFISHGNAVRARRYRRCMWDRGECWCCYRCKW